MKKTAAITVSVLFYIAVFMLTFYSSMGNHFLRFLLGSPLITALYFIIVGNIVSHRLHLNRWYLWLSMNLIGGLCSWVILLIWLPVLIMNGAVLFLFLARTGISAVVWAVVGLGFLCVKWFKRHSSAPDHAEPSTTVKRKQAGAWKKRTMEIVGVGGIILLILASVCLYTAGTELHGLRPATAYEDDGVHTFYPYRVLPTQVENTSPYSRDRRMNPTKTVYVVHYAANDRSGYKWSEQTSSKSSGQRIVALRQPVERRVLIIPSENAYITVKPDQTAESYTAELGQRYRIIMILSGGYLLIYAAAWGLIWVRKKKR